MRLLCLLTAVAAAAMILAAPSGAHIPRPDCTKRLAPRVELACARENLKHAGDIVVWAKARERTVAFFDAATTLKLGRLIRDHQWLETTMRSRVAEARARVRRQVAEERARMLRVFPVVNDWQTAVRVVQRAYPGSDGWLLSCSGGEGGHGVWKWNGGAPLGSPHYGSDAGGWMQYFQGTWIHDFDRALADVRSRGFVVPRRAMSWYSPVGQALAGGWAYGHDRPSGKWLGSGC